MSKALIDALYAVSELPSPSEDEDFTPELARSSINLLKGLCGEAADALAVPVPSTPGTSMVFEQDWNPAWLEVQDGGEARMYPVQSVEPWSMMEVRLHSYDTGKTHEHFLMFEGKRLRVTVEVLE